jgi:hypothetical protein
VIAASLAIVSTWIDRQHRNAAKANDSARPQALSIIAFRAEGADCQGNDEKAIS